MKIWVNHYQLVPRDKGRSVRRGALLKVEWVANQFGFSDLHPWPEFGEPDLDQQLMALADLNFTKLCEVSLEFNFIDREFRVNKRNAFLGLILPRSHKLVMDVADLKEELLKQWQKQGYTVIKVKMLGRQKKSGLSEPEAIKACLSEETDVLKKLAQDSPVLWRLDFNGKLSKEDFSAWWNSLDLELKKKIDFVEDPVSGSELQLQGPWANDWKQIKNSKVRIVKPTHEDDDEFPNYDRVIFTHSLDHPFGQACAAWSASMYYSRHPRKLELCGLTPAEIYEPDLFTKAWPPEGPRLKPTPGFGFGFDSLLKDLQWKRLL